MIFQRIAGMRLIWNHFMIFMKERPANSPDPSYELEAYLAQALSMHPEDRAEALDRLDRLRPYEAKSAIPCV